MRRNLILILFASTLASCISDKENPPLSGAGATFPAPFYNIVFRSFTDSLKTSVTYGAIGSGGGVRSLKDQTIDFGATDVFLSDKELQSIDQEILHIPTAIGGIVLSYNLPSIKKLKLNSELISAIYRGEITNWNDNRIKTINPTLSLPNKPIIPVFRSDGSGTTFVFSDYMSKTDNLWKDNLGKGKSLNFRKGIAAKGNPGVAGIIAETDGSIGYIGSEFAMALNMDMASLQNSSGNYIEATAKSISLAADQDLPDDTRLMITNSVHPEAYSISTFTWLIIYKEQGYNKRSVAQARNIQKLLTYITSKAGQDIAERTHYSPLPPLTKEKIDKLIESITYDGKPLIQIVNEIDK